jgi:GNAT superfamily N-acetyltransferase
VTEDIEDITVRRLRADEAPRLIDCIRRCYGDTYLDPKFYDEEEVRRLLSTGTLESIAAVTPTGEVVGHMGITMRHPDDITANAGMTLVDPRYRGRKIARAVGAALGQRCAERGLVGIHDYPVTVHAATQKIGAEIGVYTGLMLGNVPADVAFREMDGQTPGRSATLIRYLPISTAPARDVFVAPVYRDIARSIYERARLDRRFPDPMSRSARERTALRRQYDERRQILRILPERLGTDTAAAFRAALSCDEAERAEVVHVDLSMDDPCAPDAVVALSQLGFFFAGLLPEYRTGDVLRLQRLSPRSEAGPPPVLATAGATELGDMVARDRARVGGNLRESGDT